MITVNRQLKIVINRELRHVPLDWQHPTDEPGVFVSLSPRDPGASQFDEINEEVMPDFGDVPEENLGLCVYETTTEGTPMTPVFVDSPAGRWALVQYCAQRVPAFADRMMTAEQWAEALFGEAAAVLDIGDGRLELHLGRTGV